MKMMNVMLFITLVAVVSHLQVRSLIRKHEARAASIYIVLMAVVAGMYAFVFLSKKTVSFNPMSLFSIPFEKIGKYLLG